MATASVVLFWFALALYVAAAVLYGYRFLLRRTDVGWWATFLTGAGFICQTLSIGSNSMAQDGTPLNGPNQLVLASWALVLLYFVLEHVIKIKVYGAVLIPFSAALMVISRLMGGGGAPLTPDQTAWLDSWRVGVHVALIVFANAGFAVGAVSALLYLVQNAMLKKHKTNVFTRRLPSLATLQLVARRAIALAYPAYTVGLALGVIRAIEVDVAGWWSDPRIMGSGLVWLTFGVYLLLLYRHDVSGKTAARVAVVGLILVVIVAIVARTLPIGFHVFGQSLS